MPQDSRTGITPAMPAAQKFRNISLLIGLAMLAGCQTSVNPSATGQSNATHSVQASVPAATVIEARPEWFTCKTHTDCIVTEGLCGEDHAVNRQWLTPFFNYRNQMNQSVGCTNKTREGTDHTAQCVQHRCSLNPPNHQP